LIDTLGLHRCHYVGQANELLAASWYLQNNYQVYWPSVGQSSIDFVTYKTAFTRVQVKTATWTQAGKYKYLQCRTRLTNRHQDRHPGEIYDELFVISGNRAWIIPSHLIQSSNISLGGTNPNYSRSEWDKYQVPLFST
jgi:hypothetical protein